jgi:hypothetical protein
MDYLSCSEKMVHPSKNEFPNRVIYRVPRETLASFYTFSRLSILIIKPEYHFAWSPMM